MKTVMIFGTFDILHPGHINFMNQAKKHGDKMIIVIARDVNVKKIKGEDPVHDEIHRRREVEHFDRKNTVILGDLEDPFKAIKEYKPDVICLGYDQESFNVGLENKLKEMKINSKVVRLKPFFEKVYKSSLMTERYKSSK